MSTASITKMPVTAAMIAIGDELLSGRTKDKNIGFLAEELTKIGIELQEVRIIPDNMDKIIATLNTLRPLYDYIFTSGGIGPTHDDITAEAVSKAFEVDCIFDERADVILQKYYQAKNVEYTQSRRMMTRMPQGASLINNAITAAPGFIIENVYVMAGVPSIFQSMLLEILPNLQHGTPDISRSIKCPFGEGIIAKTLEKIQETYQDVSIGSYPNWSGENFSLEIVIRAKKQDSLENAERAIIKMISDFSNNNQ